MLKAVIWAACGTGFTFLMTAFGSALVFLFRKQINPIVRKSLLGFAAGIMIAASIWSLIIPAIEEAQELGGNGLIPAVGGFVLGVLFLLGMNAVLPHLHPYAKKAEGMPSSWKRTTLLTLAVTLHNIPEGMAVGISFALAAQHGGDYAAAIALCIGIGIQNFPEGAAISLPLRQEGMAVGKAFIRGTMSAIVEPLFGILVVLVAGTVRPLMPWLLSFAAGAMMFVVVEELIPGTKQNEKETAGTLSVMAGFLIMMILDVALG